jgi:predicted AlkP superfamily phosphohydrolase/phosphomutase
MRAGTTGYVRARAPLITPHNWANILTGVDAGHHGVFDFWQRGADGIFTETTSASFQTQPIWSRLRKTGLRSTFLNVPLTWPPPDVDGVIVAGRSRTTALRELFSSPDLYRRLVAGKGGYRVDGTAPGGRRKRDYIELFSKETPATAEAFEFLLNAEKWDFAMVYFEDIAMAQHYFWADMMAGDENPYRDVIASAYENVDDAIGRLMHGPGKGANIIVMSECGAGSLVSGINLNNWLERQGLLRSRRSAAAGLKQLAEAKLLPSAKRIVPQALKAALTNSRFLPKNWDSSSGPQPDLDWSQSRAFACGKEGNIFVNLAGRDPHGIVNPGKEYDNLLDDIASELGKLRDPVSGDAVVSSVSRPGEAFNGPAIEFAPDLIVDWKECAYMTTETGSNDGEVFVERWRKGMSWPTTGSHRYDGVLFASGPSIARGLNIGPITHFDLLPTWLSLLDQPTSEGLKGRVLTEMLQSR